MSTADSSATTISKDMTIGAILEGFPGKAIKLAEVMTNSGLHCVGCGAALYETLEQGILGHGMSPEDVERVVVQLNAVLAADGSSAAAPDEAAVAPNGNPISLTEKALKKVTELLETEGMVGHGLRVGVTAGGCSGFSYILNFEEKSEAADQIFEQDGLKIFMDPDSIPHLQGTRVDFVETLSESGFKFDNPNAKSACGCGSSFS